MTKLRGFSLMEVLVVVSIIAVLSAIAVAQYQNYLLRSRIIQAMVIFNDMSDKTKEYYDRKGVFPTLPQIGMASDPMDPTQSVMANSLSDYIANYIPYVFLTDQGAAYTCPSAAVGGYVSNLGKNDVLTQSQNGSLIIVTQLVVDVKGIFKQYCQYYYMKYDPVSQSDTNMSGDYVPGCVNAEDDPNADNFFSNAGNQC